MKSTAWQAAAGQQLQQTEDAKSNSDIELTWENCCPLAFLFMCLIVVGCSIFLGWILVLAVGVHYFVRGEAPNLPTSGQLDPVTMIWISTLWGFCCCFNLIRGNPTFYNDSTV